MIKFYNLNMGDGKILQQLLQEFGIKQATLAKKVGVSDNAVSSWMHADHISNERLISIGKAIRYDLTTKYERLKQIPEATELNYFNSNPVEVMDEVKKIRELHEQTMETLKIKEIENEFLREQVKNLKELIKMKDKLLRSPQSGYIMAAEPEAPYQIKGSTKEKKGK